MQLNLDEWQDIIDSHPDATPFHHRNWIELLAEQYGLRIEIPASIEDRGVTALPFIETRSLSGRRKLVSLPFTDCMRIISTGSDGIAPFLTALRSDTFHRGRPVSVKTDQTLDCPAQPGAWYRHELSLSGSPDDIASAYTPSLRRNLRRAESRNLRYERRKDAAALEDFYRLHVLTRRKLGTPVQPKAYFRRLLERMIKPGLGSIGLVYDGASAAAGAVFLEFNGTMVYKYGASDPAALHLRPNEYLFDRCLRDAIDRGFRRFDFGVTSWHDEGLRRFKRKWGASETAVSCFVLSGPVSRSVRDSLAVRFASVIIRRSPTFVCRALGEAFYKYSQ